MAFDVQSFRSAMRLDGARPNLFDVTMAFPTLALQNLNSDGLSVAEQLKFFCRAAQLPGSTVNSIPVNYFGRESKHAGNRVFQDWTTTIINDEDFKVKNAIELWMNGLNSHRGNLRAPEFASPDSYTTMATVTQYGKTGVKLRSYTFMGIFPIDISPIEVDWAANDTIAEYAVTWAVNWWETDPSKNTTGGDRPAYDAPVY